MVKIKLPEQSDVEFSATIEPDDTPVRGNFMATEDPEQDRAAEDEVIRRLDSGDVSAWCGLVVRAEWRGFKGVASLWGCSYASEDELLASDYMSALRDEAFDALCREVSDSVAKLADRLTCEEA